MEASPGHGQGGLVSAVKEKVMPAERTYVLDQAIKAVRPSHEQDEFLQAWNDRRMSPRGTPVAAWKPPQMEFHLAQTERLLTLCVSEAQFIFRTRSK
jgi:hypothetical protein